MYAGTFLAVADDLAPTLGVAPAPLGWLCRAPEFSGAMVIGPLLASPALLVPITLLIELRIWLACPSNVGPPLSSENPVAVEDELGICCGGAGWFPPADAVSARAGLAAAAPEEVPAAPPVEPAPAAATPAAAPSMPAAPAVRAVTAVPTIATAVLPTSPLTIRLAMKGITAIASE